MGGWVKVAIEGSAAVSGCEAGGNLGLNVLHSLPSFAGSFAILRGVIFQHGKGDVIAVVAVSFVIIFFALVCLQFVVVRSRIVVVEYVCRPVSWG